MLTDFNNSHLLGITGELFVVHHLQKNGFTIRARNFKVRGGEIDIIAQRHTTLAFIEVKTRTHKLFNLSQVVTLAKQKALIKAARSYIFSHQLTDTVYRFDIACVYKKNDQSFELEYIQDAFTASDI